MERLGEVEWDVCEVLGGMVEGFCRRQRRVDGGEEGRGWGEVGDGMVEDVKFDYDEDVFILRVGCNCALGHHRSVAFVCELAARPWLEGGRDGKGRMWEG